MASDSSASHRVVRDARLLLKTIRDEVADGRKPYASDVRRLVGSALALKFGEYVQFLERNGYLTLNRKSDLLAITRTGRALIEGVEARVRGVLEDARHEFGDRIDTLAVGDGGIGVRLDNRFMRLDEIGRGSLGSVWRGRNLNVDRYVAIKLLDGLDDVVRPGLHNEVRRRFELTVRQHAQLVSPFIIQVIDQNPSHTPPYVVMELATGGNLRDVLKTGPLAPEIAVRFFVQIAHAVAAAHKAGVVHGDLKPENVLFDANGNIKVTDFGFSRVIDAGQPATGRAYVGFGSLGYMSPEMFRRRGSATPDADIYALGILLYEMLVGDLPGRRSPMPTEVVEGLPKALDDLFDLMAQDDLRKRLGSIEEALELLWSADPVREMLLKRSIPMFTEAPIELSGLAPLPVESAPAQEESLAVSTPPEAEASDDDSSDAESESGSFQERGDVVTALNATDEPSIAVQQGARPRDRTTRAVQRNDEEQKEDDPGEADRAGSLPRRRATDNWGVPDEGEPLVSVLDAKQGIDAPSPRPGAQTLDTLASGMPAQVVKAPEDGMFDEEDDATGIEEQPAAIKSRGTLVPRSGRRDESKRRALEARLGKRDVD